MLRDLADLAAAIPALDHDLSEGLLPWLKGGADLVVPYAMLTHPGHDAVRGVAPGVRTAQAALDQHQVQIIDPGRQAAAQARRHVGAARAQLREVLDQQAGTFPPPLSSPLPSHPRLAPDGPVSGRGR